ncbi:MAG TPA: 50S ribosomal protein L6 [Dehalococcoidales bacterium]|nr:MAG: 50S ribosomal protein L6 [Chloroflexi bacterium RBG_16_60_22]HJX12305.1 50S ribosomal protein L6 [Dehalococcoidales bacterium]
MSRIGKMPIKVPSGVTVNIRGQNVTVKGPKGELSRSLPAEMLVKLEGAVLTVSRPSDDQKHRAYHGLTRSLLANMVDGVSKGFEKTLEIVGVGFRAEKSGESLMLRMGFSHTVEVKPLPGITLNVEGNNRIKVSGINREDVGQMAAQIKAVRPPDAYKGKGIRYAGEIVHLKPGKAGKVVGK